MSQVFKEYVDEAVKLNNSEIIARMLQLGEKEEVISSYFNYAVDEIKKIKAEIAAKEKN